jgi:hypothetical protein
MGPTRLVQSIQNFVVAGFLLGAASSALTREHKMILGEIYVILENHFRSLAISRIQESTPPGAKGLISMIRLVSI